MRQRLCPAIWITCGVAAACTSAYMVRADHGAPLWDDWVLVAAWALLPYAALAGAARAFRRSAAALVSVAAGTGGAGVVGGCYMYVLPQSSSGYMFGGDQVPLYRMFFPLVQWTVVGLALLVGGVCWFAGRRRSADPSRARGFPVQPL